MNGLSGKFVNLSHGQFVTVIGLGEYVGDWSAMSEYIYVRLLSKEGDITLTVPTWTNLRSLLFPI